MSESPRPNQAPSFRSTQASRGTHLSDAADLPLSRTRILLVFFALGAVLYFQTLGCPFLWDEYRLILGNAQAGAFDWASLPDLFSQRYFHLPGSYKNDLPLDLPYYRPVTVLLHGLTYKAVGLFFPVYHLESIFLHVGNSLLLFSLFSILLRRQSAFPKNESIALAGAVLFLVHPRNVETVSIIANQTGLLCTFFCLLSVVLWARLLEGGRRSLLLYGLSLLALLFAMLSKETAYGVPVVHGLVYLLLRPRDKKALMLLSGYFLLPGIPLVARQAFVGGQSILAALAKQFTRQGAGGGYVASVLGLLFHQLYAWLVPLRTELFQYPFSASEISVEQILLPALVLLLFSWRLRKHWDILVFGYGWFFIFYLPSSNLISIGTLSGGDLKAGAHHLYPAHAGLCLFLAASILLPLRLSRNGHLRRCTHPPSLQRTVYASFLRISRALHLTISRKPKGESVSRHLLDTRKSPKDLALGNGRMQWLALTLLVLLLAVQSFRFAAHYRSADLFYQTLLEQHPHHTGAWTNYGWHKLYIDKDPDAAERILLRGIEVVEASGNETARMDFMHNLMVLYLDNDHPMEAETMLQCITNPWVVRLKGNVYFWHVVKRLDGRLEKPADRQEETPDGGG